MKNIKELEKIFDNKNLLLFYLSWIKNGLNASKAYKELHPEVNDHSSRVLGSQTLAKINKHAVMQAYDLDCQIYFKQLREGIEAMKWNDFTGEREPDHRTRREYHKTLGHLLGIENDNNQTNLQVNVMPILGGVTIEK